MTDGRELARQYLEQQIALGGRAVVLSDRRTVAPSDGGATPRPTEAKAAPAGATTPSDRPTVPPSAASLPPGLTVEAPGRDLFTADPIQQADSLEAVARLVAECRKCPLCESRTHTVPGEGPATARLAVVGEGPGRTEDETGRPFVGQAGELLTKILAAIDLPRGRVFICNVIKCRAPENRTPHDEEVSACMPYLHRQLELLRPKVILAMGNTAAQALLQTRQSLGALRQKLHRYRGIPVVVTYHPAALLRNPNWKKPCWDDVRIARSLLD